MTGVTWRVPDWPAEDQALWRRMTTRAGPLDDGGELAHLRETSIRNVEVAYGRWLAWLGRNEPSALNEPPIPRVTLQRVLRWMDSVRDKAPNSRKMWIDGLIRFLTAAEPEVQIPFRCPARAGGRKEQEALRDRLERTWGKAVSPVLGEARLFLLSRATTKTDAVWLADTGLPYSYEYIGKRIPLLTERLIGMNVPPHFFRDALATTFARSSPDLARGTKAILGHSDFRTSERHYNHAQAIEAGRSYSEILLNVAGKQPDSSTT